VVEPERPAGAPLGRAGILAACALLTLAFFALGFPTRQLASRLAGEIGRAAGVAISFQEVGPSLSLAGPGLEARGLELATADGLRLGIARARLRAAWSLSWLRLDPAIHLTLEGPPGRLAGVLSLGAEPSFEGELQQLQLERLPFHTLWPGTAVKGVLDATLSLRRTAAGVEGDADIGAREGNLGVAALPVAVPFTKLDATLRFGADALLEVASLEARSPLYSATGHGRVAHGPSFAHAPLELELEIASNPGFRATLQAAGIPLSPDGRATLSIGGTPAAPVLR
jgi:type II secretion system protein N